MITPLYRIRDWNTRFENNRTRELKSLDWVPIPNRQDGDAYTAVMDSPQGAAIYGAWIAVVQVASRCDVRGTLLRDCKLPHTATSLSRMTRIPEPIIQSMLDMMSSPDVGWLIKEAQVSENQNPASSCDSTPHNPAPSCDAPPSSGAAGCLEGKGTEWKGIEEGKSGKPDATPASRFNPDAVAALAYLNEKADSKFREIDTNLSKISARLKEPGVTLEGIRQMIDRKVAQWKNDPKMAEYLRPETLFGKEKFGGYYDTRELPFTGAAPAQNSPDLNELRRQVLNHPGNPERAGYRPNPEHDAAFDALWNRFKALGGKL